MQQPQQQAMHDAYQRLLEAKHELYDRLMALGLGEIESIHLVNRYAWGKFADARVKVIAHLPDTGSLLDEIDRRRERYKRSMMATRTS